MLVACLVLAATFLLCMPAGSAWADSSATCYAHLERDPQAPGFYTLVFRDNSSADAEVGVEYFGEVNPDGYANDITSPCNPGELPPDDWAPWQPTITGMRISSVRFEQAIAPTSMASWFADLEDLERVDFTNLDTSQVTDMSYLFFNCTSLKSLDLSSFETSNVTSMRSMFSSCFSLESVDLSGFDTSSVTNMATMFDSCVQLETLDLSHFNTSHVTDMSFMFYCCRDLTAIDISSFNLAGLSTADSVNSLFNWCDSLHLMKLGHGFTSEDATVRDALSADDSLGYVMSAEKRWKLTDGVDAYSSPAAVLSKCQKLDDNVRASFVRTTSANQGEGGAAVDPTGIFVYKISSTTLAIRTGQRELAEGEQLLGTVAETLCDPWGDKTGDRTSYTLVVFENDVVPAYTTNWFRGFSNLAAIEHLERLDTSNAVHMANMFAGCAKLQAVDLSGFNTKNVTSMAGMFEGCAALVGVDVSQLESDALVFADSMFEGCVEFTAVDVEQFGAKVKYASRMFAGCTKLASVDLSEFSAGALENMRGLFVDCASLTEAVFPQGGLSAQSVLDASYAFSGCSSLTGFDMGVLGFADIESMAGMFEGCAGLTAFTFGDSVLTYVVSARDAFTGCTALQTVEVPSACAFPALPTVVFPDGMWERDGAEGTYLRADEVPGGTAYGRDATYRRVASHASVYAVFDGKGTLTIDWEVPTSSLSSEWYLVDVKGYANAADVPWANRRTDVEKVVFRAPADPSSITDDDLLTSTAYWFSGCANLASVDLRAFDAHKLANARDMFAGCAHLAEVKGLSDLNASVLSDVSGMFDRCSGLSQITLPANVPASQVARMFRFCTGLKSVDLNGLSTATAGDFSEMFRGCTALEKLDLSGLNTQHATSMRRMFHGCRSLVEVKLGERFTFRGAAMQRLPGSELPEGAWKPSTEPNKAYVADSIPSFGGAITYTKLTDEELESPDEKITVISIRGEAVNLGTAPLLEVSSELDDSGVEQLDYAVSDDYPSEELYVGDSPRASARKTVTASQVTSRTLRKVKKNTRITHVIIAPSVTGMDSDVFSEAYNVTMLTVKSGYLTTYASVCNCLRGSNVKTVKLKCAFWLRPLVKAAFNYWSGKSVAR